MIAKLKHFHENKYTCGYPIICLQRIEKKDKILILINFIAYISSNFPCMLHQWKRCIVQSQRQPGQFLFLAKSFRFSNNYSFYSYATLYQWNLMQNLHSHSFEIKLLDFWAVEYCKLHSLFNHILGGGAS